MLVAPSARVLPREDAAASEALAGVFRAEGIELALGSRATEVARVGGEMELRLDGGASLRGSHLLVATGRTPNTNDLGCAAGNVALDARGHVVVDERYETSERGVFAVGDCVPGPQFTHVSWDDHRVLFDLLTGRPARSAHRSRRALHGLHRSAGRGRGPHGGARRARAGSRSRSRACRSATSRARSRPTRRPAS